MQGTNKLYFYGKINDPNNAIYIDSGISGVVAGDTVGIGIDFDNKEIFLKHKDVIKGIKYKTEANLFAIWEGNFVGKKDELHINLGQEKFKYGLPPGYCPWYSIVCRPKTCNKHKSIRSFNTYISFMMMIVFCK